MTAVQTAIEYEYRFAEYRPPRRTEYEYDEIQCEAQSSCRSTRIDQVRGGDFIQAKTDPQILLTRQSSFRVFGVFRGSILSCWSLTTEENFYHRILGTHGKNTCWLPRVTLLERLKANEATHSNRPVVEELLVRLPAGLCISPLVEFHLIVDRLAMLRGQVVQAKHDKPWRYRFGRGIRHLRRFRPKRFVASDSVINHRGTLAVGCETYVFGPAQADEETLRFDLPCRNFKIRIVLVTTSKYRSIRACHPSKCSRCSLHRSMPAGYRNRIAACCNRLRHRCNR